MPGVSRGTGGYGLLRSGLAAACAVFAIGVALAVPPLRQAFVQLGTAVGFASSSSSSNSSGGAQGTDGAGQQIGTTPYLALHSASDLVHAIPGARRS